jgi:hypothetical protein
MVPQGRRAGLPWLRPTSASCTTTVEASRRITSWPICGSISRQRRPVLPGLQKPIHWRYRPERGVDGNGCPPIIIGRIKTVAPSGAWIETYVVAMPTLDARVAPCAGAWIETTLIVLPDP